MNPADENRRRLQERMRYEILRMLYTASRADPEERIDAMGFAVDLGAWEDEVWNNMVWLEHAGFVRIHEHGRVVSITLAGVRYIDEGARRRRTVRGITPPAPSEEG